MALGTALAAKAIRHPYSTWILDDGARGEVRGLAERHGIGHLTRGPDWADRPGTPRGATLTTRSC